MSGLDLVLRNLAAWSLQAAVLGLTAAALGRVAPVDRPWARLTLAQSLLALVLLLPLLQPWTAANAAVDLTLGAASAAAGAPADVARPGRSTPAPAPVVAAVLAIGIAWRLSVFGVRLGRLHRVGRASRPLEPEPWLAALRDEVAPRARFALVPDGAPATFGFRRPLVLLPESFLAMAGERQRAVALHELLHARRGDWLMLVLEDLVAAVLFFHPAVHWLVDRVRLAREQCVDADVVRRVGARRPYLESLVDAARAASFNAAVPAALLLRQSHLRERVDLLLQEVSMSRARTAAHVSVAGLAVVLAVALSASAMPLQSPAASNEGPAAKASIATCDEAAGTKASSAICDEAAGIGEPKIVKKVNPAYPAAAKSERVEGAIVVDVVIRTDGSVKEARVGASAPTPERLKAILASKTRATEGDARLGEAAVDAVKQWAWQPVLKDGKPVEANLTVTVVFRLD
jgi:beta-lactamase regulating signal transducer with metallopeptidase domain